MVTLYRKTAYMQTKVPLAFHIGTWCFCFGGPQPRMGVRIEICTPLHWFRYSSRKQIDRRKKRNNR